MYANRLVKDADGYLDYVRGSLENLSEARVAGCDARPAKYRLRTGVGTFTTVVEGTYTTKSTTTNSVHQARWATTLPCTGAAARRCASSRCCPWAGAGCVGRERARRYFSQSGYQALPTAYCPRFRGTTSSTCRAAYRGFKNMTLLGWRAQPAGPASPRCPCRKTASRWASTRRYADVKGRTFTVGIDYKFVFPPSPERAAGFTACGLFPSCNPS
jgi:iron complex outermembrane receptor protein